LSVTIRDAQHLCWKNFRLINDKLNPERGKAWTPQITASELLTEASKVAKVTNDLEDFDSLGKPETKEMLATELSNLVYLILVLAEHYKVELEDSFLQTVNDNMLESLK
jgi:NTP pyrophosphatase (non-canonical NTP hydrolase)